MRSTCSWVASPSCTSRSASRPNGRSQRLTRKPGPSPASITWRPIARPSSRVVSSAASPDCSPATTSTSFITGAGLKKCMPTTRSGPGTPAAISVTLSDEVLVASTQSSRTTSATLPNSERLSSSDSGAASITMSASASAASSGAASTGPAAPASSRPFSTSRSSRSAIPASPRSSAVGVGVVDERARARRRGELRDAGAHRAGAEDPDDGHYDGTSAFSPVSARPMISFWICEVPS